MQDDDLRQLWARHDEKLDRCLRLNEERLRTKVLGETRTSVLGHRLFLVAELVVGAVALLLLGFFVAERVAEPRWVAAGGALHVFVAGVVGLVIHQLVLFARLDYDGPVNAVQRAIERIELAEYRAFKWTLLGGVLLWVLVPIVAFEALSGVDLFAEVPAAWIVANLVLGVVVLAIGQAWSRKHVEVESARPWARRLVKHLSGRSLQRARRRLTELASFELEALPGGADCNERS
jgi:hypothetical protein